MTWKPYVSPQNQLLAEVLLFVIPTGTTLILADISLLLAGGIFIVAFIIAVAAKYYLVYTPRVSFRESKLTSFLDHHLKLLISDYQEQYNPDYDIRTNVMIPQEQTKIEFDDGIKFTTREYLQIAYYAGGGSNQDIKKHDKGDRDETKTEWSVEQPAEGNCGKAFVSEEVRVAGRKSSVDSWQETYETTQSQDEDTKEVNSILSAPIRKPSGDEPIAILNIDAHASIKETNFNDPKIKKEIAERYAEPIGTLL